MLSPGGPEGRFCNNARGVTDAFACIFEVPHLEDPEGAPHRTATELSQDVIRWYLLSVACKRFVRERRFIFFPQGERWSSNWVGIFWSWILLEGLLSSFSTKRNYPTCRQCMCVRGERWVHSQSLFILASCVWFVLWITVFFQRWGSTISIVMGNLQWRKISSWWWLCSWRGRPATTERGCDGYDCPVPEMRSCRNWEGMLWSYFADIDGRCQR